ncbi:MAG: acyl-CoA dehydrogenase C-terminal domain-containing protein, partial [Alphaproteobacteria bacterium]|nr:acyl-CoA dehydrogenase C-terminal domain-containing protein [Alphaproteobacteria bacterium]
IQDNADDKELSDIVMTLAKSFARLQQATAWIAENGLKNPMEAGAASSDYLKMFGLVALGFMWGRMAKVSTGKIADGAGDKAFHENKVKLARYYMTKVLPDTSSLMSKIMAGADPVMSFAEEAF